MPPPEVTQESNDPSVTNSCFLFIGKTVLNLLTAASESAACNYQELGGKKNKQITVLSDNNFFLKAQSDYI